MTEAGDLSEKRHAGLRPGRGLACWSRSLALSLTVLASVASSRALAAEPKPDFSIKTKWVEASVILDAKIKSDPALAANCLAEGKAWAAKNRADAAVGGRRYVSIVRADYEYTGGAHPNSSSNTILWDRSAGKRISIRAFFTETADNGPTLKAMQQGIVTSLKAEKKKRGAEGLDDGAIEGIEPKLLKIGPVSLAPSTEEGKSSGLTFHYSPYTVGSYAEGGYVAFVPWEALKPYLTPEGSKIFGGARPKGDDEDG
jgi:hypothetical protein